jgi:predicted unusual protein kinase regulating ubiquinone biosynthesis (AarF/ABC1/UbiB family)
MLMPSFTKQKSPFAERAGEFLRTAAIVWRLGPLALSIRRDFRRWLRWGDGVTRSRAFHERRARRLVHEVATLGPAFVKIAQIFGSRPDLVPEPYVSELAKLTDRVPPVSWEVIRDVLTAAWGAPPGTLLESIDLVPLAAGSLGQVHRAQYQGRDVVVKVLRPGVGPVVARDVRIARTIVDWVYRRFPNHHVLGFRVVLDEFALHVGEEMDFVREAMQCARMRERFADEPRLRIPHVERELTRPNVVVLEYLPGTRIDALDARVAAGVLSPHALVETLIEIYARMMLRDGVFHADPHPGNLLVDDEGRLVLLDFGMIIDVPISTRKALFQTTIAAVRRDVAGTTDGFFALGLVAPGTSRETMYELVTVLLEIAYSPSAIDERARVLVDRVMRELFDWPVVLPGELVYFARTAALIEGIGARYDRRFNSIRVASPVAIRLRKELLAALIGEDPALTHPVVSWAAMLGAFAGGATVKVGSTLRRLLRADDNGTGRRSD